MPNWVDWALGGACGSKEQRSESMENQNAQSGRPVACNMAHASHLRGGNHTTHKPRRNSLSHIKKEKSLRAFPTFVRSPGSGPLARPRENRQPRSTTMTSSRRARHTGQLALGRLRVSPFYLRPGRICTPRACASGDLAADSPRFACTSQPSHRCDAGRVGVRRAGGGAETHSPRAQRTRLTNGDRARR